MSNLAKFCYKVTDFWHPDDEIGIPWNDPDVGIEWPLEEGQYPILAERDTKYKPFECLER